MTRVNEFGQPIGEPVADWRGCQRPLREAIPGRYCVLDPLDVDRHGDDLYAAYSEADRGLWTYMADGPYDSRESFRTAMAAAAESDDPLFFAIVERASGRALGRAAYLRIAPEAGSIEVGSIAFGPRLQRTVAATEAMFLMMQQAFEHLGYRRYEWKCDSLNEPSRRAAERLGFSYEGLFRQALVYKGRNRDTAWYAIVDRDWPAIRQGFERWFDLANFDRDGHQKQSLASCMATARELG